MKQLFKKAWVLVGEDKKILNDKFYSTKQSALRENSQAEVCDCTIYYYLNDRYMKNWKLILEKLKYWQEQDNVWQEAMNEFCKTIAPNEYAPIVSPRYVETFIEGIDEGRKTAISDWLSYIIYEVPSMKDTCEVKDEKGIKYDFKKDKDIIKFFKNNY